MLLLDLRSVASGTTGYSTAQRIAAGALVTLVGLALAAAEVAAWA